MTYTYSSRYPLITTDEHDEKFSWTVDVVRQLYNDRLKRFKELQRKGYDAGELQWKAPREYKSFTYNKKGVSRSTSKPKRRGGCTTIRCTPKVAVGNETAVALVDGSEYVSSDNRETITAFDRETGAIR